MARSSPFNNKERVNIVTSDQESRFGLAVRRSAGKQSDLGSAPLWLSFLFKSCGLWTLSCIVQELCESRGGRPGLSVLTSLLVSGLHKKYVCRVVVVVVVFLPWRNHAALKTALLTEVLRVKKEFLFYFIKSIAIFFNFFF